MGRASELGSCGLRTPKLEPQAEKRNLGEKREKHRENGLKGFDECSPPSTHRIGRVLPVAGLAACALPHQGKQIITAVLFALGRFGAHIFITPWLASSGFGRRFEEPAFQSGALTHPKPTHFRSDAHQSLLAKANPKGSTRELICKLRRVATRTSWFFITDVFGVTARNPLHAISEVAGLDLAERGVGWRGIPWIRYYTSSHA